MTTSYLMILFQHIFWWLFFMSLVIIQTKQISRRYIRPTRQLFVWSSDTNYKSRPETCCILTADLKKLAVQKCYVMSSFQYKLCDVHYVKLKYFTFIHIIYDLYRNLSLLTQPYLCFLSITLANHTKLTWNVSLSSIILRDVHLSM